MERTITDFNGEVEKTFALRPCPYCGKDIAGFLTCIEMQACKNCRECDDGHYLSVACSMKAGGCGASSGFFPTFEQAAKAWNMRRGCLDKDQVITLVQDCAIGALPSKG